MTWFLDAAAARQLAKDLVALFGGLCLVFNVLLPVATIALQFAEFDAPEQFAQWRRHRKQQQELAQLTARIERLTSRKRASTKHKSKHRVHKSDSTTQKQPETSKAATQTSKAQTSVSTSTSTHAMDGSAVSSTVRQRKHSADSKRSRPAPVHQLPRSPRRRHRLTIHSPEKTPASRERSGTSRRVR